MSRLVIFLLGAALCVALFLALGTPERKSAAPVRNAVARARAYYSNENNQDYRNARAELLSVEAELESSAAYQVDLALVDLGEFYKQVQGEQDVIPTADHRALLHRALRRLERASALAPQDEGVQFNLARTLARLAEGSPDYDLLMQQAEALVDPLLAIERPDPAALYLKGAILFERGEFDAAADAFERLLALGRDFVPATIFRVASYKRARSFQRSDDAARRGRALALLEEFDKQFEKKKVAAGATERGRYTKFRDPLEEGPSVRPDPRKLHWHRVTARAGVPPLGRQRFFIAPDVDRDCARDLLVNGEEGLRLLRNYRNATFNDLTESAGLPLDFVLHGAAVGDLDNDLDLDLVVCGPAGVRVFLNDTPAEEPTKWHFKESTASLGATAAGAGHCVVLIDLDHDGDLDLFVGGERNRVYRTVIELPEVKQGEQPRTELQFTEIAEQLGMQAPPAHEALLLDVDDDHAVDLLVTGAQGNAWFHNQRALQFVSRPLAAGRGLEAADVDNDLVEEVRIGGTVYDTRAGAAYGGEAPSFVRLGPREPLLDLDSDGVIDRQPFAGLQPAGKVLGAVGSDLNRDGNRDLLLLTDAGLDLYMSSAETPAVWIDVLPQGLRTNRAGIGTRLRLYAGDLRIGATVRDGLHSFGLGRRTLVDALLVRWTNGVEQGVVLPQMQSCLALQEREGELDSCPFLYVIDGERGHFVTDCQSGTPLGLPYADGKYLPGRSNETVMIPTGLLEARDGKLYLDLTEELREVFYVDQVRLRVIDHRAGARPVLNEAFRVFSFPEFSVHCLPDLQPPRSAVDHKGRDVLAQVRARDRKHAVVFDAHPPQYTGLARSWSLELDFGDLSDASRILFIMDGWTEFPTASASIASAQSKTVNFQVPQLELIGPDGKWRVVDKDAGFPAGKNKSVLLDLSGKFHGSDGRVRLSGTQRIHWDAFFVCTGPDGIMQLGEAPLLSARSRFRGFSAPVDDPTGELPRTYDYGRLQRFVGWNQTPGMHSRHGDVRDLLRTIDDRYAVLGSGDSVELVFDASGLPELPDGWVRDFCFTTEGWVKDQDMNQAVRQSIEPLPFHGMSAYPYPSAEKHPDPDFVREWLTRPARILVDLEALLPGIPGAAAGG